MTVTFWGQAEVTKIEKTKNKEEREYVQRKLSQKQQHHLPTIIENKTIITKQPLLRQLYTIAPLYSGTNSNRTTIIHHAHCDQPQRYSSEKNCKTNITQKTT